MFSHVTAVFKVSFKIHISLIALDMSLYDILCLYDISHGFEINVKWFSTLYSVTAMGMLNKLQYITMHAVWKFFDHET